MYDLYYNFIKKIFHNDLLFTDTDCLTYNIKSEDVYEEFFKSKHLFNLGKYPKDSSFFAVTNNKVIFKMKDMSKEKK